jgi:hypothetical protein
LLALWLGCTVLFPLPFIQSQGRHA